MPQKTAVIIGAGPAGLTAAYELVTRSNYRVIVLQRDDAFGGISRTVTYRGNRMDIGGHRFFSKNDRVMDWWFHMLPLEEAAPSNASIAYHRQSRQISEMPRAADAERVMLLRQRKSRIFFRRQLFDYPLSLSLSTLSKLGWFRSLKIMVSYLRSLLFPLRPETNLEQFFINRFGRELYQTFFKSYTEKVWGTPCHAISSEWGKQRIKGLSIRKLLQHLAFRWKKTNAHSVPGKEVETSLIESFLYPKYGPGQMWEEVARRVQEHGGRIDFDSEVIQIEHKDHRLGAVIVQDRRTQATRKLEGDVFFSTMAIQDLIGGMTPEPPQEIQTIAEGLVYRDFVVVGMLLKSLKLSSENPHAKRLIDDNWIYIQEPDVQMGRLQIFNNWSPAMVADSEKVWLGLEYFCDQGDGLWTLSDEAMIDLARQELAKLGIADSDAMLDATVVREPKTYPAYFGTYSRFSEIRTYLDRFPNLFPIGRNGMHRYNNQDHSMLTAMLAVDNLLSNSFDKSNLWNVNTEQEYHETKRTPG